MTTGTFCIIVSHLEVLLVNPFPEFIGFRQVRGLVNLRFSICGAASACEEHPFVVKSDVMNDCKPVVGYHLLIGPEIVVCGGHKQGRVFDGIFLVPAQGWMGIFLRNAIEPFNECFDLGGQRPEQKWGSESD